MADASVSQELTVTWMSVTGASSYQVDYKLASATDYQLAAIVGPNATSYTIMNLFPNSNYSIRLTAIGTSGQSLNSTPVVITAMTAPVAYDLLLSHEDSSGKISPAPTGRRRALSARPGTRTLMAMATARRRATSKKSMRTCPLTRQSPA